MMCVIHGYFEGWCDICYAEIENQEPELVGSVSGDDE